MPSITPKIAVNENFCALWSDVLLYTLFWLNNFGENGHFSWDAQAEKAINKGRTLMGCFGKYLTQDQFLKVASSNYNGSVFHGSSIWFDRTKMIHLTKLNSLHFRLLRTAVRDFKFKYKRDELTSLCKCATPGQWNRFITASKILKIVRDSKPSRLFVLIMQNYFEEPRKKELDISLIPPKRL